MSIYIHSIPLTYFDIKCTSLDFRIYFLLFLCLNFALWSVSSFIHVLYLTHGLVRADSSNFIVTCWSCFSFHLKSVPQHANTNANANTRTMRLSSSYHPSAFNRFYSLTIGILPVLLIPFLSLSLSSPYFCHHFVRDINVILRCFIVINLLIYAPQSWCSQKPKKKTKNREHWCLPFTSDTVTPN